MILCVDVGNTLTTLGLVEDTKVKLAWSLRTSERTTDEYILSITSFLSSGNVNLSSVKGGGMCCVVPSETQNVKTAIERIIRKDTLLIDGNIKFGIKVSTDNPSEVGGDRIANAAGAFYHYTSPAIVIDMGTATTFDYVTEDGEYLGGVIAPGLMAGARDLWKRTRMLPEVIIKQPERIIGTNTVACMQAGIFYGALAQVEGIVRLMWKEIGFQTNLLLTGGHARLIRDRLSLELTYDPHLTLKGIAAIVKQGPGQG